MKKKLVLLPDILSSCLWGTVNQFLVNIHYFISVVFNYKNLYCFMIHLIKVDKEIFFFLRKW